jgi:hypothetical protein
MIEAWTHNTVLNISIKPAIIKKSLSEKEVSVSWFIYIGIQGAYANLSQEFPHHYPHHFYSRNPGGLMVSSSDSIPSYITPSTW